MLAGKPDIVVAQLDADGLEVAAVDDGRDHAGVTQAAARTLALHVATGDFDFVGLCHC